MKMDTLKTIVWAAIGAGVASWLAIDASKVTGLDERLTDLEDEVLYSDLDMKPQASSPSNSDAS